MHNKTLHLALAITLGSGVSPSVFAADANGASSDPVHDAKSAHFDNKGKPPSAYTIELQNGVRKTLPFADKRDFEEAKKGFIAAPSYNKIMAEAGNVAWNMGSYDFLLDGKDYDSINPSLQRQAILNMALVCTRWCRTRFTRCAGLTWRTSRSSRAIRAGLCSTR